MKREIFDNLFRMSNKDRARLRERVINRLSYQSTEDDEQLLVDIDTYDSAYQSLKKEIVSERAA